MMGHVLIIEDSDDLRFSLSNIIKKEGFTPCSAASGAQALNILNSRIVDLIFLDIGLPDINGIELISSIRTIAPHTDIVMLTGADDAKTAINSLKAGAMDYILKPFEITEFKKILKRIMQARLATEQIVLDRRECGLENIIGTSNKMLQLKKNIKTAAAVKASVLISGETGTGKELVARAIHSLTGNSIFVKVDCGTLSPTIIESELFGYEKGAFTDARSDKKGLLEMADNGTLFLDEIGNLPLELQPRLLRLIEESTFRRVGGLKDLHVTVKIIAATNIDIEEAVANGGFREDLYYRLNVLPLTLPPLRERGRDILLLADCFLRQFNQEQNKKIKGFTAEAEKILLAQEWQGNIRELKNCIERQVIYCREDWITPEAMGHYRSESLKKISDEMFVPLEQMELRYIKKVLESTGNNKTEAARFLGISRTTLREKLKNGQMLTI